MDLLIELLIEIGVALVVGGLIWLLVFLLQRSINKEEAKFDKSAGRTRSPKALSVTCLVLGIVFILGFTVCTFGAAFDGEVEAAVVIGICGPLIGGIFILLYAYLKTCYEIIEDDGFTTLRLFGKKRTHYKYTDFSYFFFAHNSVLGGMQLFDENRIPKLRFANSTVGLDLLADKLTEAGVTRLLLPTAPTKEEQTPAYKAYAEKNKERGKVIVSAMMTGLAALMLLLVACLSAPPREFENYEVQGSIENATRKDDVVTVKLRDDETVYIVNNLFSDKLDYSFTSSFMPGDAITLKIAYTDDSGRKNVSEIVLKGKTYLSAEASRAAAEDDYKLGVAISIVSAGATAAGVVVTIVFSVSYAKKYRKKRA